MVTQIRFGSRASIGFSLPVLFLFLGALLSGCSVSEEAQKVQNLALIPTLDKAETRYFLDYQIFYLGEVSRPGAVLMIPLQSKFAFDPGAWRTAGGAGPALVKNALQSGKMVTEIRRKATGDLLGYLLAMPGSAISFLIDPNERSFVQEERATSGPGPLPPVILPPKPPPPRSSPRY